MPVLPKQTQHTTPTHQPKKKTATRQGKPTRKRPLDIEAATCLGTIDTALSDFASHPLAWVFKNAIKAVALAALVLGIAACGNLAWWMLLSTGPARLFTSFSTSSQQVMFSQLILSSIKASTNFFVFAGIADKFESIPSELIAEGVGTADCDCARGIALKMRASSSANSCSRR